MPTSPPDPEFPETTMWMVVGWHSEAQEWIPNSEPLPFVNAMARLSLCRDLHPNMTFRDVQVNTTYTVGIM